MGKVRLVDTGKGSFFGNCLYEQVLDRDDFGGVAAAVGLSRPGAQGPKSWCRHTAAYDEHSASKRRGGTRKAAIWAFQEDD